MSTSMVECDRPPSSNSQKTSPTPASPPLTPQNWPLGSIELGHLARYVLDRRIPLEMCLLSNLHTGACKTIKEHPSQSS